MIDHLIFSRLVMLIVIAHEIDMRERLQVDVFFLQCCFQKLNILLQQVNKASASQYSSTFKIFGFSLNLKLFESVHYTVCRPSRTIYVGIH